MEGTTQETVLCLTRRHGAWREQGILWLRRGTYAVGVLHTVQMNAHVDALFDGPFFRNPVSVAKPSVGLSWNSVQFFTEKQLSRKRDFCKTRAVRFTLAPLA